MFFIDILCRDDNLPLFDQVVRVIISTRLAENYPQACHKLAQCNVDTISRVDLIPEDLIIDSRACVVVRSFERFTAVDAGKKLVPELINQLAVRSLKYETCLLIIHTDSQLTPTTFIGQMKQKNFQDLQLQLVASLSRFPMNIKIRFTYGLPRLISTILHEIHSSMEQQTDHDQLESENLTEEQEEQDESQANSSPFFRRQWMNPINTPAEHFLASFPSLNHFSSQVILYHARLSLQIFLALPIPQAQLMLTSVPPKKLQAALSLAQNPFGGGRRLEEMASLRPPSPPDPAVTGNPQELLLADMNSSTQQEQLEGGRKTVIDLTDRDKDLTIEVAVPGEGGGGGLRDHVNHVNHPHDGPETRGYEELMPPPAAVSVSHMGPPQEVVEQVQGMREYKEPYQDYSEPQQFSHPQPQSRLQLQMYDRFERSESQASIEGQEVRRTRRGTGAGAGGEGIESLKNDYENFLMKRSASERDRSTYHSESQYAREGQEMNRYSVQQRDLLNRPYQAHGERRIVGGGGLSNDSYNGGGYPTPSPSLSLPLSLPSPSGSRLSGQSRYSHSISALSHRDGNGHGNGGPIGSNSNPYSSQAGRTSMDRKGRSGSMHTPRSAATRMSGNSYRSSGINGSGSYNHHHQNTSTGRRYHPYMNTRSSVEASPARGYHPSRSNHTYMNHHHHLPRRSSSSRSTRGGYGSRHSGPTRTPRTPRGAGGVLGGGVYSRDRGGLTPNLRHNQHSLSHSQYEPQLPSQYQHQPSPPHEMRTPRAGPDDYYRNRTLGIRPSMDGSKQVLIHIYIYIYTFLLI